MDWYFKSGIDDLVVPKDQEFSDRVPSPPGVLSKWGNYAPESFVSPNKYFSMDTNSIEEEINFDRFCNGVDVEASVQDKGRSSDSSICAGSQDESLQRSSLSSDQPDYQLDHFAGIEQLDDIFLDSLLEDYPRNEDLSYSYGFNPGSQHVLPTHDRVDDMSLDSKSNSMDTHSRGCSKYLKSHAFSSSVGWNCEDVASPQYNSEHKIQSDKERLTKLQVPSEQKNGNELVGGEGTSLEESVFQDLRNVMTQMTDETRICFRDALYRLADNSKQHGATSRQNGDDTEEISSHAGRDTNMRLGKRKAVESETNVIDRAIANLLFINKMDLNEQDYPTMAKINQKEKVIEKTGSQQFCSSKLPTDHFSHDLLADDAEVPTFA